MTVLNTQGREGHRYLALLEEMGLVDETPISETGQGNVRRASTISAPSNGATGDVGTP